MQRFKNISTFYNFFVIRFFVFCLFIFIITMDKKPFESISQGMTEFERLELAKKLDSELDDFIDKLPKRKYEDGWPEERWEEEMVKHPFFMKQSPTPGQDLHPLYEGLQKLKYDPEENEPYELAIAYKDDGNFNFKHKNYRLAIVAYTEGIKQRCGDPEIDANLLNNRAAAHWFLKNYRSSLKDCELALKLKPDYDKALNRAAHCAYHLKDFDKSLQYCDIILDKNKTDKDILKLRTNCINEAKVLERNDRKKQIKEKKEKQKEETLIKEILTRGYKIDNIKNGTLNLSNLEPCFPELVNSRVFIDSESKDLVWPVVLAYPEYKIMDYIQQFSERTCLYDQLQIVFETYPEWDSEHKYKVDQLNVYYETENQKVIKVNMCDNLGKVLKNPSYIIRAGTPSFIVVVKNSVVERKLLEN